MVEVRWRNGFAVGLTAGICSILIINTWGGAIYEIATCLAQGACQGSAAQPESGDEPEWWRWVRRLISAEDSLAQWSMAVLSLMAVVLLWLTLKASRDTLSATRRMALDAREIGEAQVRAYLTIEDATVSPTLHHNEELVEWHFEVSIRNTGHSPARGLRVEYGDANDEQRNLTICKDLASGAEERTHTVLTYEVKGLDVRSRTADPVSLSIDVTVSYRDVFCAGDEFRTEAARFVGPALLLEHYSSALTGIYQLRRRH